MIETDQVRVGNSNGLLPSPDQTLHHDYFKIVIPAKAGIHQLILFQISYEHHLL